MGVKIDKKIVNWEIKSKQEPTKQLPKIPKTRPLVLSGDTYKIKNRHYKEAFYVTINDLNNSPYELFIRTKNEEAEIWIQAVTLMASAVFRQVDDPQFLIDEMMEISDPRGGHPALEVSHHKSIIAEIGYILNCRNKGIPVLKSERIDSVEQSHIVEEDSDMPFGAYIDEPCNHEGCTGTIFVKKDGCPECQTCFYSKCS